MLTPIPQRILTVSQSLKTILSLFLFAFLIYKGQAQERAVMKMPAAKKVECPQLQISFLLPSAFNSLDEAETEKLSKQGKKAIKEEFNKDKELGWQKGCINLRDSLKRLIVVTHMSVKEAQSVSASVKKFIDSSFDEPNEFLIRRIETKMGIKFRKEEVASQSTITIAGYQVSKDAITLINDNSLLIFARYYFFEKNGRLYLLSFIAGNATDNQQIEKAMESALKM